MKKAVLFDYDGVIADTMDEMYEAWKYSFLLHGKVKISKKEYFLMEGNTAITIAEKLRKEYKINKKNVDTILKDKEDHYFKNNSFKLSPGIREVITFIKKKGLKTAIVSGAPKSRIRKMVGERFFNKFDLVIGSGDVSRGKPYPDPYEKALKKFKILPEEAIVIENAPLGIRAAKAAGIYCIAIESTLDKTYLKKADRIVGSVKSLLLCLKKIL
jgi:beta-phosphoglucomutase